jgi:hypothetical protein
VQQMVRADRADLVLPRRQRVPLQQHTIALQHAATTRRRHACRVPHAARDSTATRRVTSSVRNARVHACACLATRERARVRWGGRALVWAQEAGCLVLGRRHVRLQPRQLAVAPHLACAERSAL